MEVISITEGSLDAALCLLGTGTGGITRFILDLEFDGLAGLTGPLAPKTKLAA